MYVISEIPQPEGGVARRGQRQFLCPVRRRVRQFQIMTSQGDHGRTDFNVM